SEKNQKDKNKIRGVTFVPPYFI
ncbi:MAG: hypothetical protein RL158_815, partial [Bacteroidota bacterium]